MNKILLILDLDETLIHATKVPLERPADFQAGKYFVYKRPFLASFLAAVEQWYDLAVWTSASGIYAREIVENVFPTPADLKFVWSGERCTYRLNPEMGEYYNVKDLKKVKRAGYALDRVLMIDDTPEKLERQYGNHLFIRPFEGDIDDTELRDILPFLEHLQAVENMRRVEKRHWRSFSKRQENR